MSQRPIVVLGGGVSGLGAAWRLASRGVPVIVLERDPEVGGLSKSRRENGCGLDVGPHSFFSEEGDIVATVLELFDPPLEPSPRKVKFYYQGRYLDYPLSARSVLLQMGPWTGLRCALSYLAGRFTRRPRPVDGKDESVEQWAVASFGRHLYRTFFKPYTEQFWKVPCRELSSRSIPTHTRMSFANTLRILLHRKTEKIDASLIEREMLPTYYPPTGFGEIPERIAAAVSAAGGTVLTASRAVAIETGDPGGPRVVYERDGRTETVEAASVISTIPLNDCVRALRPAPPPDVLESARRLDYRPLVILGMVTSKPDILEASYIYVMNRPFNRISEMNKFSPGTSPPGKNILVVEIPCLADSIVWKASAEHLYEMCSASLAEDGFIEPGEVEDLILIKSPAAYPIYRLDYAAHLGRLLEHVAARPSLSTLGRSGEFMYMDIDKCLSRAFAFADRLLAEGTAP